HCTCGDAVKVLIVGLLTGVGAGILAGLVGVGGWLVVVPALVFFFGMGQHAAQGTSLAVLLPPTGLFAFLRYYQSGHVDMKIAVVIVIGVLIGGWFGGGWAQQVSGPALRKGFAVFMMLAGLKMFFTK